MKSNSKKARRKRWFKSRLKYQRREQFKKAWRQHFINKGILPKD